MTILELFKSVNKEDLKNRMKVLHPDYFSDKHIEIFYKDISNINPIDINDEKFNEYKDFIVLINQYYSDDTYDGTDVFDLNLNNFKIEKMIPEKCEKYYNVDGIHINQLKKNHNILSYSYNDLKEIENFEENGIVTYGLDFIPREIVLSLPIAQPSIDMFGVLDVAVEIFNELTFYGLTEDEVQTQANEVFNRLDEIEKDDSNWERIDTDSLFEGVNKEEIDFSVKVSLKIGEFNHTLHYDFLRKVYDWILTI